MHVALSMEQYNIGQMNEFYQSVAYNLLPNIDHNAYVSPKLFGSKHEVKNYLLHEMGASFLG